MVEGADVNDLRVWANGLAYEHMTFEAGSSPGDTEGGEVYTFVPMEDEAPGFSYVINGKDDCYLLIGSEWYQVSNPSAPPVSGSAAGSQDTGSADPAILRTAPELIVVDSRTGKETTALRGAYSWTYPNGDGSLSSVIADCASPLDREEFMPALDANGASVELSFSTFPDELEVHRWEGDSWGDYSAEAQPVDVTDGMIQLEPDSQIYEVVATWNSSDQWGGSVSYAFYSGPADEIGRDLGVTLSVKDATPESLTLVCTQSGGNPTGELMTGAPFWLESYVNGVWEATPRDQELVAFTSEAWLIPLDGTVEWEHSIQWLYPDLGPGTYRIGKEITDFRAAGDYDSYILYAEFELTD